MMKSFYVSGTNAVLSGFLALAFVGVVGVLPVSAEDIGQDVPEVVICDELDALNYGEEGTCRYEEEGTPFCSDVEAVNYEAEEVCVYDTTDDEQVEEDTEDTPTEETETDTDTEPEGKCEIEGHKYELYETEEGMASVPLENWLIGLMKVVTREDGEELYYPGLAYDLTDEVGYYCLEWDGYTGTPEPGEIDGLYSFVYRVYEYLFDGWKNVSIELGPDASSLIIVPDENVFYDTLVDGESEEVLGNFVSIEISEENGVIIADAALHVDFYNQYVGEGEEDVDTYKVTGYVWEDKNENDTKDVGEETPEQTLSDWIVKATSGETVITDMTDANGVYELDLPTGTWTICVELKSEWAHTFPNTEGDCYMLTLPIVVEETPVETVIGMVRSFILPTAYAATIETYTDYNFGVVFKGCVENCGGSGGSSSGGGSSRKHGSKTDKVSDPEGEVLGEATSVLPTGAPDTGMGGTSTSYVLTLALVLGMIVSGVLFFRARHVA